MAKSECMLLTVFVYIFLLNCCNSVRIISENSNVVQMRKLHEVEPEIRDALSHHLVKRAAPADSGSCQPKNDTYESNVNKLSSEGRTLGNEVGVKQLFNPCSLSY